MTDDEIIDFVVQAYKTKELTPKRYGLRLNWPQGIYIAGEDRQTCALGAVLCGTKRGPHIPSLGDDIFVVDAADILGVSVATATGIFVGFDQGTHAITVGAGDKQGVMIGAKIAEALFPKTKKYQT